MSDLLAGQRLLTPFSFDTETALIRPGLQAPPLACISFKHAGGEGLVGLDHAEEFFWGLLRNKSLRLFGHNVAYDLIVMAAKYPDMLEAIFEAYEDGRIGDTMLRTKLVDIAMGRFRGYYKEVRKGNKTEEIWVSWNYSLDDCYYRVSGKRLDKDSWRLKYGMLRHIPIEQWPEGARHYPIMDAVATDLVREWNDSLASQVERTLADSKCHIKSPQVLADEEAQCRAAWWIQLMKAWGIRTSVKRVGMLTEYVRHELRLVQETLQIAGLVREDGTRNLKAATERMIVAMGGIENCKKTDKDNVALDEDACKAADDDILYDYADFTSLGVVLSKDIAALLGRTKESKEDSADVFPIHSNFDTIIATGRTSSSNPNIQNIRRLPGIRECFVPRKGYVFLDADYDGLELRCLAQACLMLLGKSKLAESLNSGRDPHLEVASVILHQDYAYCSKHKKDPEVFNARQLGKVANFGFPGGLGYTSLISFAKRPPYNVILSEEDARKLKQDWFKAYPEMAEYFALIDKHSREVPSTGGLVFVEHLFSARIRGMIPYTVACNSYFQGLGSDATKAAGYLIARECYLDKSSPLYGCRIVNYIHDQFLVEAPIERAHDACMRLKELMIEGATPYLPDVPPTVSEPLVADCWSKDAKAVFGEDGRLVPWTAEFVVQGKRKKLPA